MKARSSGLVLAFLVSALLSSGGARAGEFSVNPVRIELSGSARSGAVAIRNEGQHPLGFQIQAMEWTQNKDGQDQYSETADLVFYPKIVTIEPGRERVVRVGTRTPVVTVEKTYRLFIEELPTNVRQSGGAAAQISFLIRFGAPIFVAPVKAEDALKVGAITWSPGQLTVSASNAGNRHQAVTSIQLRGTDANGKEVFAKTLADRYLLAGVTKSYRAMVTVEECHATSVVEVEIKTDKASAKEQSRVTPAACAAR